MGHYNWNPFKTDRHKKDEKSDAEWNLDPRDENYYLGRIQQTGDNDLKMRYFSDGETSRYYRRNELEEQKIAPPEVPFKNNAHEGTRKRK